MSRELVAALARTADPFAGLDALARAQFWEGFSGAQPYAKVRSLTSPRALLDYVHAQAAETTGTTDPDSLVAVWWTPGNTGLYKPVLYEANRAAGHSEVEGVEVLQENMARADHKGSVFWTVGKLTAHSGSMADKLRAGLYTPVDASVLAKRLVKNLVQDQVRMEINRTRLEEEQSGDMAEIVHGPQNEPEDWRSIVEMVFADPGQPGAEAFLKWLRDEAAGWGSPPLVDWLTNAIESGDAQDKEVAAAHGITPGRVSQMKSEFIAHVTNELASGEVDAANALSDAAFLRNLARGRIRGDKVGSAAVLRTRLIRLAHEQPELRAHLLPLLHTP